MGGPDVRLTPAQHIPPEAVLWDWVGLPPELEKEEPCPTPSD